MFSETPDSPLVFYIDFLFYRQVETLNLEGSLGSNKLNSNTKYAFKVNLAAISFPRIELRLICFVIGEITNEPSL